MQGDEQKFEVKLPARITGLVFWGLVFIGLLFAVIFLQQAESDVVTNNNKNTLLISYQIEELIENFSESPVVEKESARIRAKLIQQMEGKPVVFRTLDIGGDKALSYYQNVHEQNPGMGMRSIRFSLQNKPVFIKQIRAILRAGVGADLTGDRQRHLRCDQGARHQLAYYAGKSKKCLRKRDA